MELYDLRCKGMNNPLGIRKENIVFSWKIRSEENNIFQKSYRITLTKQGMPVWDSGTVESGQSLYIPYTGPEVESRSLYVWTVKIETNTGEIAESEPQSFETAIAPEEFRALWVEPKLPPIKPDPEESGLQSLLKTIIPKKDTPPEELLLPCSFLRKEFLLVKPVKQARLYMTAHGIYRFEINGEKPSDRLFAPEWTSYHKNLLFQTYDVSEALKEGKNVFGAVIADGWWGGRIHYTGMSCRYGDRHGLLMQLEVTYTDDSKEVILSDDAFRCTTGPYRYSDIFIGECYDASCEMPGWSTPGYDDTAWKGVETKPADISILHAQEAPPVRIVRELKPKAILHSPKGETILDAGQVLAGKVRMRVTAPKGTVITLQHSELLDQKGNYLHNIIGTNKQQTDVYICKGEGEEIFEPAFTFHGFRYVKITGYPGTPRTDDFTVLVTATDQKETGSFSCSDQRLNQLQHNIFWSQMTNFLSIPTDCPQRERDGWTGDIGVFGPTALFNQDCLLFLRKWLEDLRYDQLESGAVPDTIPFDPKREYGSMGTSDASSGWGDASVILPWTIYCRTGDKLLLEEQYDSMKKWISFEEKEAAAANPPSLTKSKRFKSDPELRKYSRYLWNTGWHYGDWLIPSKSGNGPLGGFIGASKTKEVMAAGYFANTADLMSRTAEVLGKEEDAEHYRMLYKNICHAFTLRHLQDGGNFQPAFQGVYVMALAFRLIPEEYKDECVERLIQMIHKNNGCLDTGFLSVGLIMDVLSENGHLDEAYKLLYQEKCPSWLYEVKNGATTMWEAWNAVKPNGSLRNCSFNHYAFGCVGDWMYRTIGGIRFEEAGYRKILICPEPDDSLTFADTIQETPYGTVRCSWKKENGKMTVDVEIPCNTTAKVIMPDGSIFESGSGKYSYACNI